MPYALCPMSVSVPHVSEKGHIIQIYYFDATVHDIDRHNSCCSIVLIFTSPLVKSSPLLEQTIFRLAGSDVRSG